MHRLLLRYLLRFVYCSDLYKFPKLLMLFLPMLDVYDCFQRISFDCELQFVTLYGDGIFQDVAVYEQNWVYVVYYFYCSFYSCWNTIHTHLTAFFDGPLPMFQCFQLIVLLSYVRKEQYTKHHDII